MSLTVLIGMEVHLQLRTRSKMFCRCPVRFGAPPNTLVCPVCLGMPGALPVPNREALLLALELAGSLGCTIAERIAFDRKNYAYPDLPKGYQITQFAAPLAKGGSLAVRAAAGRRAVRLRRLHVEEDTGKSLHDDVEDMSRIDFNRAGTPLAEIVSEPDLRSPAEARAWLQALRTLVRYLDVSDGNMEEGNLRCEPNVNLRITQGAGTVVTPVVEIKNLNSVRHVERALHLEIARQRAAYEARGAAIATEERTTCGYDEDEDRIFVMRRKEAAHDYRYLPEPDIPPIGIGRAWREEAAARVPELPEARAERLRASHDLSAGTAVRICRERGTADYFEQVVAAGAPAASAAAWILGELSRLANRRRQPLAGLGLQPGRLASLLRLVANGAVARQTAIRQVLPAMLAGGEPPERIVEAMDLGLVEDRDVLRDAARRALGRAPTAVADYRAGRTKALAALMGLAMRETGGRANPHMVRDVLIRMLEEGECAG